MALFALWLLVWLNPKEREGGADRRMECSKRGRPGRFLPCFSPDWVALCQASHRAESSCVTAGLVECSSLQSADFIHWALKTPFPFPVSSVFQEWSLLFTWASSGLSSTFVDCPPFWKKFLRCIIFKTPARGACFSCDPGIITLEF